MNYQNELLEPMVISIIYSDQTIIEMFKIYIKIKLQWI